MGIPWSGYTEGNGDPYSLYEYRKTLSNRTSTSVHLKLEIRVRMRDWSNYFSFQIAHETMVYVGQYGRNGVYQSAWIKQGRGWWGHQWEGDSWLWEEDSYDYAGNNWHGWYTVFDKDIKIDVDESEIFIVPCITRPPCLYDPYNFDGEWTPSLDKTNWEGHSGYWRPFGADEYPWYWYFYDHEPSEDMAFGNNRNLEALGDGTNIGKYPRPANVTGFSVTPTRIDVSEQDSKSVKLSWNKATNASGYEICISKGSKTAWNGSDTSTVKLVASNATGTSLNFNPKQAFVGGTNWKSTELKDGDKFYIGIRSHDSAWVRSTSWTWVGPVTYYEVLSTAPTSCFVVGRNGVRNECLFIGETLKIYFSGQTNGSYPIDRFVLRRQDGVELSWKASEKTSSDSLGKYVTKALAGWSRANQTVSFELRAYNTKNREVRLASYNSSGTGDKWFKFDVKFYGGVMYVYGKSSYTGNEGAYNKLSGGESWEQGMCRVYGKSSYTGNDTAYGNLSDSESWHDAEMVYVWNGKKWSSL